MDCSPWGREESDTTDRLHFDFSLSCSGEGNGNPLQYSCLENPRDRSLVGCCLWGRTELDTADVTQQQCPQINFLKQSPGGRIFSQTELPNHQFFSPSFLTSLIETFVFFPELSNPKVFFFPPLEIRPTRSHWGKKKKKTNC